MLGGARGEDNNRSDTRAAKQLARQRGRLELASEASWWESMQNRTSGEPARIRRETEKERLGETGTEMKRK